jgi:hypothetical protein
MHFVFIYPYVHAMLLSPLLVNGVTSAKTTTNEQQVTAVSTTGQTVSDRERLKAA